MRECLSINPQSAECLESSTAFHWLRTEYFASLGKSTEREIRIGMKAADDSLKVTPNNGLVLAYRGKLLLIRAQSSSGAERQKSAQEAQASFDQAFKAKTDSSQGIRKRLGRGKTARSRLGTTETRALKALFF